MPIIEISLKDLGNVLGKKLSEKELEELSSYSKIEIEKIEGDAITVEIKDSNRPDLLSTEGIAREFKGILGKEKGIKNYPVNKSDFSLNAEKKVGAVRPAIACAVVKNISLDSFGIKQIIQLQEKLCEGFGRKRKEAAIGIYDFDKIKWPVTYTTVKPDGIKFIPLEMSTPMTPLQILQKHEKGREYGKLLENAKEYPLLIDSAENVLSMPPVINSNYSGKVTEKTKNLFVEVTGFREERIMQTLNIVLAALADRNGRIYSVKVNNKLSPDFSEKIKTVSIGDINESIGLELKEKEIISLLEKARYNAKIKGKNIEVTVPFYRTDVIHPFDIIEDIAIAYGYSRITPKDLAVATTGGLLSETRKENKIACLMTGLNFQETATMILSNKDEQFKKMNLAPEEIIEIKNPLSLSYTCMRKWLLPSLMGLLSQNTTKEYPQKVFETGFAVNLNQKAEEKSDTIQKFAAVIVNKTANFTEIKQILDYLAKNLGFECSLKSTAHPSFIEGRCGEILIKNRSAGIFGEINPKVLENFGLNMPVSAIEIDISEL